VDEHDTGANAAEERHRGRAACGGKWYLRPGFEISVWQGLYVPKGTPKPVIDALVKAQDEVLRGQCIGACAAEVSARVHASLSGKVLAIEDWPHPTLGYAKTVVIEGYPTVLFCTADRALPVRREVQKRYPPRDLQGWFACFGVIDMPADGALVPVH
jgi:hypothetical protein